MKEAAYKVLENRPNIQEVYQTSDGTVFLDRSYANIHGKVLKTPVEVVTRAEMLEKTSDDGQLTTDDGQLTTDDGQESATNGTEAQVETPAEAPAEATVETPVETPKTNSQKNRKS